VPQDLIANLEALLAKGNDAPSLRFALATRYLASGDAATARACPSTFQPAE
jgi:hypothetical protein